jgi:superfamily II DNA or RNA helicase
MSFPLNLIKHFPYAEPHPHQKETLDLLESNWDNYDVFVVLAPTAFGKSSIARTLMSGLNSVSLITPTNLLVNQFIQEFPETRTLARIDSYRCEEWKRPCSQTRNKLKQFCKG